MKRQIITKILYILGLWMAALLFRWCMAHLPAFRTFYLHQVYPSWSHFLRLITGWCPFSIGDILYTLAGAWLMIGVLGFIKKIIQARRKKTDWWASPLRLIFIVSCFYLVFIVFWGINYRYDRLPAVFGVRGADFSVSELTVLCHTLGSRVNTLHRLLAGNDTLPIVHFLTFSEVKAKVPVYYREPGMPLSKAGYPAPSIKPSMYSYLMNFASVTGYFNPFTGEAQVNTTPTPPIGLPFTTCHEVAHQLGFAAEDNANFVGYVVAASSPDPHFQYSANYEMFLYSMNALSLRKPQLADSLWLQLTTPGVRLDYEAEMAFYDKFRTPFRRWSNSFYDEYLKMNEQPKGIRSYNEVVSLLIDYFRQKGKLP